MYTMSQVQACACTRICIWRMYIIELLSELVYKLRSEIMDKTIENFLRYVKIDTQSSEESTTIPSTMKQHDLARQLVSELEAMGAAEITYDKEHCYVYATIPASAGCEKAPVLGFISHMDTSPAVTDTNVNPRIVENYDGKDIVLNAAENIVMKVEDFPELQQVVTYTTRPIRAGETYGKEYFFVSEEEMHEMQEDDKIIECRVYQTVHGPWYYFTANDGQINLEKGNYILITTLEGYRKLETFFGIDQVVPIYIEVDDFDRIERALKREKEQNTPCVAELCRRFLADEEDFSEEKLDETGIDIRVRNDDFEEALSHIETMIQHHV